MFQARTVETLAGHVGQVFYNNEIVWESHAIKKDLVKADKSVVTPKQQAENAAREAIKSAVRAMFASVPKGLF